MPHIINNTDEYHTEADVFSGVLINRIKPNLNELKKKPAGWEHGSREISGPLTEAAAVRGSYYRRGSPSSPASVQKQDKTLEITERQGSSQSQQASDTHLTSYPVVGPLTNMWLKFQAGPRSFFLVKSLFPDPRDFSLTCSIWWHY